MSLHELTDEQREIRDLARRFADERIAPNAAAWDRDHTFPEDVFAALGELGLMGVCVPAEHGGAGADFLSYVLVLEELSRADAGVGVTVAVHTSACSLPILQFGTEEQRVRFVPLSRPSRAVVRMALASDPEPDSVSANAPISSPAASAGTHLSPPWASSGSVHALVCTATVTPTPASARESSSSTST